MKDEFTKFNYFEKLFFRIQLGLIGLGFITLGILFASIEILQSVADLIIFLILTMMSLVALNFIISVARIIKYLRRYTDNDNVIGIKRSVTIMLTSPIAFVLYYLILIILALSMASCSY